MKCPICRKQMEYQHRTIDEYGEHSMYYHCYNHDGGAVFLELTWREYTKEELDYE